MLRACASAPSHSFPASLHQQKTSPLQKNMSPSLRTVLPLSSTLPTLQAQQLPPLPERGTLPPKASDKPLRVQPNAGNPKEVLPVPEKFRKPALVVSPDLALKTFTVPEGFHVEMPAAESTVQSPAAINSDENGRLLVVEMQGYMQDLGGNGKDLPVGRIKRLESPKKNRVYDKVTAFVDHLVMPRAVMPFGDGVLAVVPPISFIIGTPMAMASPTRAR